MRFVKIAIAFIASVVVGAFCFLTILAVSDGVSFRSLKVYTILSGSMEPKVPTGSIILVRPMILYSPGDIISFKPDPKNKMTVTHRITKKLETGVYNSWLYETKGDANNAVDLESVKQDQIVGKVFFTVPYIGYAAQAAKTQNGFIFLIIVPSTIIIYEELKTLKKELTNLLKKLKSNKTNSRALIFVPMIASLFVFTSYSRSFFSDKETSSNNSFQAGIWTTTGPSTTPTTTPTPTEIPLEEPTITPSPTTTNTLTPTPTATPTPTPRNLADHIVISEIQIKGANANQDFVELYNPTENDIDISGWRLRKRISSGTESSLVVIPNEKSILAHGYFLWANSDNGFSSSVGAGASNGGNISENNSIALLNNTSDTPIDQVAWGTGHNSPFIEGNAFLNSPATNESIERKAFSTSTTASMTTDSDIDKGNAYDSNNNANDFVLRTTSQPQNTSSTIEIP